MIKVQNVSKSFKTSAGSVDALKNVSLEIADSECVVIAGENGSGKSVLMSIISGLEKADKGKVVCSSRNDNGKNARAGLVFQEAETQILGETVLEDVEFGPKNLGWNKNRIKLATEVALEKVGLTEKKDFPARFLSGGEKRRLAVASQLAMERDIIIFDEPYANLDFTGVKQVNSLVKQLKQDEKTVIILTHEIEKCLALADKFVVLFRGEKVFDGTVESGLKQNLEQWNIRNPLVSYKTFEDLLWL